MAENIRNRDTTSDRSTDSSLTGEVLKKQENQENSINKLKVRSTFLLSSDVKRRLKHYMADHPGDMSDVANKLLDEFLKRERY